MNYGDHQTLGDLIKGLYPWSSETVQVAVDKHKPVPSVWIIEDWTPGSVYDAQRTPLGHVYSRRVIDVIQVANGDFSEVHYLVPDRRNRRVIELVPA